MLSSVIPNNFVASVSDFVVNDSQELCPSQDHSIFCTLTEMVRRLIFSKDNVDSVYPFPGLCIINMLYIAFTIL